MGPLELRIADLALDLENPRFAGAKGQRDALQKIIDDQQEKLVALAEHVVEAGMNPMDRFLVLGGKRVSDGYIVLEGNRRLAALRILANPTVLDGLTIATALKRSFDKLAKRFERSSVEPLSCFEVDDRVAGNMWIQLRHTGQNGGRGIVDWSGVAASRFRGQDPALQALEFVRTHGDLDDAQKEQLDDRFPITTLDRLLSSREVRQELGFDVKNGKLLSGLPAEELMKPLRGMVLDLAERRINVSTVKNREDRAKYLQKFDSANKPDLSKVGKVRAIEGIGANDFKSRNSAPRKKPTTDPSARRTLVPRRARLSVTDNRTAEIFRELGKLKIDEARNAIAVLFRVFLELSVDHYMERHALPQQYVDPKNGRTIEKNLKLKVQDVVDHLVANGGNRKDYAGVIRGLSVTHSPLYIDLLNAYVHNRFTTPQSQDLVACWNDSQRLFEGIWT